ncbi:hypothetical protein MPC4_280018 [Methylocella tundrae]|uniref:Uncharacterized protein n=1 Tax=Methylocella tundrae TaxID=227605 RepID=A0A8B6M949_METTU|nr:hypothetical protein MPC1_3320005 [Methylocella tundrae]VTZ50722.1 hypothetical protein MPC4_280018 [Methylocella tundrae]
MLLERGARALAPVPAGSAQQPMGYHLLREQKLARPELLEIEVLSAF